MFANLKAEQARHSMTNAIVAEKLGISRILSRLLLACKYNQEEFFMTKEEILQALAYKYRVAYSVYETLSLQAKEAIHEGDMDGYNALTKRAMYRSQYLGGIKTAAVVLGIDNEEFMAAVNADRNIENSGVKGVAK